MKQETVYKIRQFNRIYMPVFDLLGNSYLGSEYSATEARVLFEIYYHDGCNAAYISKKMNIDKSYLSRIIKRHEKSKYLTRKCDKADLRAYTLHLTDTGKAKTEDFIEKSNRQISEVISPLKQSDCERMSEAIDVIIDTLKKCVDSIE